ncbi:MAG: tetratricopeptide repeat protein [Ignavibacteriae bacterium]|nr:tetratricopeptide repeat protein [Ignavibacteriota bacterium]
MQKLKSTSILYLLLILISFTNIILSQESKNVKSLLFSGEYQKVINILEKKLSEQDSLSFNEYNTLGVAYQRVMNFSNALSSFKKASKLKPDNIQNQLLIGNCYNSLGNNNLAKFTYQKILELDSVNLTAMVSLGKILIELDEFKNSSELYQKLILMDSTNSYFYSQLGICELKKNKKISAKKHFEKSIELNNNSSKTILRLAKLYYNDQEFDEAKRILQEGLSQNSQNKALNKMIAEVFYKKKQYEEAIIKYLYVISIGDTSTQTYQRLGLSYYYMSFTKNINNKEMKELKLNEAISAFTKSYQKNIDNSVTALYLGLCNKALDKHKTAIKYFEESLKKMFPDYIGEVYKNLAISNEQLTNYHDAIINYQKAIKYFPSNKLLTFYLASVYDRYYRDKSVAMPYYKKFLKNNNSNDIKLIEYARSRLEQLDKDVNFWGK